MWLYFYSSGKDHFFTTIPVQIGTDPVSQRWVINQPVKAYADPGTTVQLGGEVITPSLLDSGASGCLLTGHFIDLAL